jgi:glycine cleavage system regulatory protein
MTTALVVTVVGSDRPGIVNQLSETAQRFGANWAEIRMASLAGQFAGIVHLEVPPGSADALAAALRGLAQSGLQVVVVGGEASDRGGRRAVHVEVVGHDRPGIVHEVSRNLASRSVSIDALETEVASAAMSGERLFRMKALLAVPGDVSDDELRRALEGLANEMMIDIEVGGDAGARATPGA